MNPLLKTLTDFNNKTQELHKMGLNLGSVVDENITQSDALVYAQKYVIDILNHINSIKHEIRNLEAIAQDSKNTTKKSQ